MGEESTSYIDIVVKVMPKYAAIPSKKQLDNPAKPSSGASESYDTIIYTDPLNLSEIEPDNKELPEGEPKTLGGLPFVGVEQVKVHWSRYRFYISSFLFGEKAAGETLREFFKFGKSTSEKQKETLFEVEGKFLKAVLNRQTLANRPLRLWWSSDEPELMSLPWDLMIHAWESDKEMPLSFVRGIPPDEVPKIPLTTGQRLRLALIHEPSMISKALLSAFDTLPPDKISVVRKYEASRQAIQEAVQEGFELIHIIADGTVSLANEGSLYLRKSNTTKEKKVIHTRRFFRLLLLIHKALKGVLLKSFNTWIENALEVKLDIEKCSPSELSAMFYGSRVGVLCLSAPKSTDTDADRIDGYHLPTVYRSFTTLACSRLPLPSIVAPIGASDEVRLGQFWKDFYSEMAASLDVCKAASYALKGEGSLPVAVFLHNRDGQPFKSLPKNESTDIEPTVLNAALELSRDLVKQLMTQGDQSLPESIKELLSAENKRQERLKSDLQPWL
jgi:hypothetical protein